MYYPVLRPRGRKSCRVDRFYGLDRRPGAPDGCFSELENLSAENFPNLRVRARRTYAYTLDGNMADNVLAVGGKGVPVILDCYGNLRCGGHIQPHILDFQVELHVDPGPDRESRIEDFDAIYSALDLDRDGAFNYCEDTNRWIRDDEDAFFPGSALTLEPHPIDGELIMIRQVISLDDDSPRRLVFLGGWVCVFPDGVYVNTVRLRQGQLLEQGVDWGKIEQHNVCGEGRAGFLPCAVDGTPWTVTWSDTAPASGLWVDTGEVEPVLKTWSESRGLWAEVNPYVKCSIPGIAKYVSPGDCVELQAQLPAGQEAVENLWNGSRLLIDAWHDPGDANRAEGAGDYVILEGLLPDACEIQLNAQGQDAFSLHRKLPEMDFVVECANRLWGCRWGGGVNELYGCKLGDFRNWAVFEGLSTDSYRVSRGEDGPFTGAAVLGGCPLFFRENCLEKIYPSARGDHGVVTVSLSGIEAGSARSAVVIRDSLYYKSPTGFCCYGGTLPKTVSEQLGDLRCRDAVGAALGERYYVSARDSEDNPLMLVLDTRTGIWTREDGAEFDSVWSSGTRIYYTTTTSHWLFTIGEAEDSNRVNWHAETVPLGPVLRSRRYLSRLQLTARLDPGSTMRAYLSYDNGPWTLAGVFRGSRSGVEIFPIVPRRSGRVRLRLEGRGGMVLESISWLMEQGSDT